MDAIDWQAYGKCPVCNARPGVACRDMRAKHIDKPRTKAHEDRGMARRPRRVAAPV